jgi:hypothetical protein
MLPSVSQCTIKSPVLGSYVEYSRTFVLKIAKNGLGKLVPQEYRFMVYDEASIAYIRSSTIFSALGSIMVALPP